jgi:hypothetical protein
MRKAMRKLPVIFFLLMPLIKFSAQETHLNQKQIILSNHVQTVPEGKVWKLQRDKPIKVQFNPGTLESGSLCNAWLLTKPSIVSFIRSGSIFESNIYNVIISDFKKIPYTNDITYLIYPISFIDKSVEPSELMNKLPEEVGMKELVYFENESVSVGQCLLSLEITEYDLSKKEKKILAMKKEEYIKSQSNIDNNFNIPFKTEKYVKSDTPPEYCDKGLKEIFFESESCMYIKPSDTHYSFDDTYWYIRVTKKTVELYNEKKEKDFSKLSPINAIRKFKLLDINFQTEGRWQEFKLSEYNNKYTHNLTAVKDRNTDTYFITLFSIDKKEMFQFNSEKTNKKFKGE